MKTKINLWHCAILLLLLVSSNAQQYSKSGPVSEIENLQKIDDLQSELSQANQAVSEQQFQIANLERQSAASKNELALLRNSEKIVSIYGLTAQESFFQMCISILLGSFFMSCLLFVFKFRSANFTRRKATEALANLENEYEDHVRKSLEREQKLRRLLQDELNRHKISQAS